MRRVDLCCAVGLSAEFELEAGIFDPAREGPRVDVEGVCNGLIGVPSEEEAGGGELARGEGAGAG